MKREFRRREKMKYMSPVRCIAEGLEGVAVAFAAVVSWPVSRQWLRNWGSLPEEQRRSWPGDALVLPEHTTHTRAVTIRAPVSDVWPWLTQFGLGRAGFYSYELLERLVGIPVRNVESIVPEYQHLAVGDEVLLHPKAPGIPVAALEREKHICFGVVDDPERPVEKPDPARSWSIYIEPRSESSSRLLLRSCVEPVRDRRLSKHVVTSIETPIDFVMEQRMLRTIKRLAERRGGATGSPLDTGRGKAWLPPRWFITTFWHAHRRVVRASGGRKGLWPPRPGKWGALRLTTTGRRSGEPRSVIIGYYEDGPNLVSMAMNGWGAAEPAWWLNLQADPQAVVELADGTRRDVCGTAAVGAERERLWQRWRELDKNLDSYAARRPRATAVVVLEPRSAATSD